MEPTIIVALIGFAGVCVSSFLGQLILNYYNNKREAKREKRLEAEALKRQEEEKIKEQKDQEWQARVEQMVTPIGQKVDNIDARLSNVEDRQANIEYLLAKNEDATILSLRVDMKNMCDRIVDNELEPDQGEKITWKELYKTYYKHGGNHYKEAVDEWGKKMKFTAEELKNFKEEAQKEKEQAEKALQK